MVSHRRTVGAAGNDRRLCRRQAKHVGAPYKPYWAQAELAVQAARSTKTETRNRFIQDSFPNSCAHSVSLVKTDRPGGGWRFGESAPARLIFRFRPPSNRCHRRHQKMPCFDHGAAFRHNRKKSVLQSENPAQSGQEETVVNGNPAVADLPLLPAAPPHAARSARRRRRADQRRAAQRGNFIAAWEWLRRMASASGRPGNRRLGNGAAIDVPREGTEVQSRHGRRADRGVALAPPALSSTC